MDRAEFMSRLTNLLMDVPPMEREEAIQYYNDYFDDAGAENEAGVIASLGTPEELAASIKAGLSDGGNAGEFTEAGFKGYGETCKNEVMKRESSTEKADNGAYSQNGSYGQNNPYGQNSSYSQNNTYGQNNPYGQNSSYGHNNPYGQSNSYGQSGSYGRSEGQMAQGYSGAGTQKKPMSGGMIALIVIAVILSSPLWIGLAGGLLGIAAGLFGTLLGLFLSFLIAGVVLVIVGIALFIAGIAAIFPAPLGGLCMIGGGMICFAVGLVFIWLMVIVIAQAIPGLVRGIVNLCHKLFHRGGAQA